MSEDTARVLQTTVPAAVRRFWWLVAVIALLFAGLGAAYSHLSQPIAIATASLVVEDPRSSGLLSTGAPSASYVLDQAVILQLPVTVDLVARDLRQQGLADLSTVEFLDSLEVVTDGESNLLRISFRHPDPRVPPLAVNNLVERYREVLSFQTDRAVREQLERLDATIATLEGEIAAARAGGADAASADLVQARTDLVEQRARLQLNASAADNGIRVVSPSREARIDEGLGLIPAIALGGLVGAVPGAAAAYLLAQRRRRFSFRYQPEIVLGRPLLSEIPSFAAERISSDLPVVTDVDSSAAESFRFLASALAVQQRTTAMRTVAIVSAASGDGKTTIAANLAVTAAQAGSRVLAVDADLSGQGLGFLLLGDRRSGPGLVQALGGSARPEAVIRTVAYGGSSLDVLPAGTDEPFAGELFASSRAGDLLSALAKTYDLVVLDVPPVLQVAYAASLLGKVDGSVLVVPHGAPIASLEELGERLTYRDVAVAGYVYNKAPLRREIGRHSRLVDDHRRRPGDERPRVTRLGVRRGHDDDGRSEASGA